jgi:hypothetical protein
MLLFGNLSGCGRCVLIFENTGKNRENTSSISLTTVVRDLGFVVPDKTLQMTQKSERCLKPD